MFGKDITLKSEEALKTYVDIKKKLHDERSAIENHSHQINDQFLELNTNVGLLEKRNEQIENKLKTAQEVFGVSSADLTTDQLDKIITVSDPVSEKIMYLVAKHNALEDCMAAIKKGYEKDVV